MAQGNKIIGRDRFKELVYAQAFREHRHFYAFLYGEQMCVFRSRSTRPRLGCWNVTGWRTRTFPTKSNRGEPKSGTLEVRRCVTLH